MSAETVAKVINAEGKGRLATVSGGGWAAPRGHLPLGTQVELKVPLFLGADLTGLSAGLGRASPIQGLEEWGGKVVAPGQTTPVILHTKARAHVSRLTWSAGDDAFRLLGNVNYGRRCLVPALLADQGGELWPSLLAGVWSALGVYEPSSFSLLKVAPDQDGAGVAVLPIPRAKWADWLNPQKDVRELLSGESRRIDVVNSCSDQDTANANAERA